MRYIKDELFTRHSGRPFVIQDTDSEEGKHEATVIEVLRVTMAYYDINHALVAVKNNNLLSNPDVTAYNAVMKILEGDPQENGYYRFESTDFEVLQKVVGWAIPLSSWWRDAAVVENLLEAAVSELPEAERATADGEVTPQAVASSNGRAGGD